MLVAVAAAYSAAPLGGFVWDDVTLILEQQIVRELQPLTSYFDRMFFGGPVEAPTRAFYRPLVVVTFALDWQVWGGAPLGFHLTNLLLHLGCVAMVFALGRKWGAGPSPAALGAALFGLLPRLSEAVAWISGRTDLLAAFFVLGALLVHDFRRERRWAAALLLLCGLLSKEVAIAGVVALALLEVRQGRRAGDPIFALGVRLFPLIASAAAYAALRVGIASAVSAPGRATMVPLIRRFSLALEAIGNYAWMWLDPLRPRTQIGSAWVPNGWMIAFGALVLTVSAVVIFRVFRHRAIPDIWILGSALIAVPLFLVLHLIPLPLTVVAADRFLYLPAAGAVVVGAPLLSGLPEAAKRGAAVGTVILCFAFAASTYLRTFDWEDEVTLWTEAVEHAPPGNSLPFVQLGIALVRTGEAEVALPYLAKAEAIDDDLYLKWGVGDGFGTGSREARALALATGGQFDAAIEIFAALANARPQEPMYGYNIAAVRAMALDFEGAERELSALLQRYPEYDLARQHSKRIRDMETRWRSLPPDPRTDSPEAALLRAELYRDLGRMSDAKRIWRALMVGNVGPAAAEAATLLEQTSRR